VISEREYEKMVARKPTRDMRQQRYFAKRIDANQPEIVSTLRKLGFQVDLNHELGRGRFDIDASKQFITVECEIKDGTKAPSARQLTPKQRQRNFISQRLRCVLTCKADCLRLNEQVNAIIKQIRAAGIVMNVTGCQERQYEPSLY
jgi:hypothetical protein